MDFISFVCISSSIYSFILKCEANTCSNKRRINNNKKEEEINGEDDAPRPTFLFVCYCVLCAVCLRGYMPYIICSVLNYVQLAKQNEIVNGSVYLMNSPDVACSLTYPFRMA